MTDSPDLLKIGDFARAAGTNLRTLRYYEELGLIHPAARSAGGFRYYRPTDVNRVQLIRDLQELGLQLDRIRDLLGARVDASGNGDGSHGNETNGADGLGAERGHEAREALLCRVREALVEHERLLVDRMALLESQRERVAAALQKLAACEGCPHTPSPKNNYCEPCERTSDGLPDLLSALF